MMDAKRPWCVTNTNQVLISSIFHSASDHQLFMQTVMVPFSRTCPLTVNLLKRPGARANRKSFSNLGTQSHNFQVTPFFSTNHLLEVQKSLFLRLHLISLAMSLAQFMILSKMNIQYLLQNPSAALDPVTSSCLNYTYPPKRSHCEIRVDERRRVRSIH